MGIGVFAGPTCMVTMPVFTSPGLGCYFGHALLLVMGIFILLILVFDSISISYNYT